MTIVKAVGSRVRDGETIYTYLHISSQQVISPLPFPSKLDRKQKRVGVERTKKRVVITNIREERD